MFIFFSLKITARRFLLDIVCLKWNLRIEKFAIIVSLYQLLHYFVLIPLLML